MKKIFIFLCLLNVCIAVSAQHAMKKSTNIAQLPTVATEQEVVSSYNHPLQLNATPRTAFFFEDFANGFAGNNGFGAWTHEDSGSSDIWMMANANSPGGAYSSTSQALQSPTKANGWVIFDADLYNTQFTSVDQEPEPVTGWLQTPELDCSALTSVIVEYYQDFRYCCYSPSPLTLEVSSDGGTTWASYPAHGSFVPSSNALSANPLKTTVDISCAAAGKSNVFVRWGFDLDNTSDIQNLDYTHYFWGLDDITIYENPIADDIEVLQVFNGDVYYDYEIRVTPFEQRVYASNGGLYAGVVYRNNGYLDQTNTVITVEILDESNTVLATKSSDPFTMESFAHTPECPSLLLDTLYMATGWEPSAIGKYTVRASISSDATDEVPDNNSISKMIEYSTDEYGHDDFSGLNAEISPRKNPTNPNEYEPVGYGNYFSIENAGSTAYGLTVVFGPTCGKGVYFSTVLYHDYVNDGDLLTSEEYFTTEGQLNGMPQYYAFEEPISLFQNDVYFCAILNAEYADKKLTVRAQTNSDSDNSTAIYQKGGSGDFSWFSSQSWTPAIRMILSNRVGIDELSSHLSAFQLYPNPAKDIVKVQFNLTASAVIAYEVRDMNGKLVDTQSNIGRYYPGTNSFDLNVSHYATGNYTVSLVVDGATIFTRQLNVTK